MRHPKQTGQKDTQDSRQKFSNYKSSSFAQSTTADLMQSPEKPGPKAVRKSSAALGLDSNQHTRVTSNYTTYQKLIQGPQSMNKTGQFITKKYSSKDITYATSGKSSDIGNFISSNSQVKIDLGTPEMAKEGLSPMSKESPGKDLPSSDTASPYKNMDSDKFQVEIKNIEHKEEEKPQENLLDSQEAKVIVGKPAAELKYRKQIKEKLKVTKIPDLMLEEIETGETHNFNKLYKFISFLGTGSFGFVVQAVDRDSGEMMALKIVDAQSGGTIHSLKKEAEILQSLPESNNVIRFKHLKVFTKYVIMGIEYAKIGTLQSLMKKNRHKKHLTDEHCAKIVKGILMGLKHIHRNDYVHRDLKPSNVVISDENELENLKLIDFGLAVKYQTKQGIDDNCGTLVYQAPEQMAGGQYYGKAVDIWAAGFIMYELIARQHPLWERGEDKQTYKQKALNFKKLRFGKKFSSLSQNLIEKLCNPKPSLRYTVEQALQHPWITRKLDDEIPRNHMEQQEFFNEVDGKFRKIMNLMYFFSVVKNSDHVQMKHQQQKLLLIKNIKSDNIHQIRENQQSDLLKNPNYKNGRLKLFRKEINEPKSATLIQNKDNNLASKILELREQQEYQTSVHMFANKSGRKSHNDLQKPILQEKSDNADIKLPQLFIRNKDSVDFERLRTENSRVSENGEQTPGQIQRRKQVMSVEHASQSSNMKQRQLSVLKPPMGQADNRNILNISASVGVSIGLNEDISSKFKNAQKSVNKSEAQHRTQRAYKITKLQTQKKTMIIEDQRGHVNMQPKKTKSRNSIHLSKQNSPVSVDSIINLTVTSASNKNNKDKQVFQDEVYKIEDIVQNKTSFDIRDSQKKQKMKAVKNKMMSRHNSEDRGLYMSRKQSSENSLNHTELEDHLSRDKHSNLILTPNKQPNLNIRSSINNSNLQTTNGNFRKLKKGIILHSTKKEKKGQKIRLQVSTNKKVGKSGVVTSENTPIKLFGSEQKDNEQKKRVTNLSSVVNSQSASVKNKRKYSNVAITQTNQISMTTDSIGKHGLKRQLPFCGGCIGSYNPCATCIQTRLLKNNNSSLNPQGGPPPFEMMVHDGKKTKDGPYACDFPMNFSLIQSLPDQLQQQTRGLLQQSDLITIANIKIGARVCKRLDWPQFQYGIKGIHPPNGKKGTIIAYSDTNSNKFGQQSEFIARQLQWDQLAIVQWDDKQQASYRVGFAGEFWLQRI